MVLNISIFWWTYPKFINRQIEIPLSFLDYNPGNWTMWTIHIDHRTAWSLKSGLGLSKGSKRMLPFQLIPNFSFNNGSSYRIQVSSPITISASLLESEYANTKRGYWEQDSRRSLLKGNVGSTAINISNFTLIDKYGMNSSRWNVYIHSTLLDYDMEIFIHPPANWGRQNRFHHPVNPINHEIEKRLT